MIWDAFLDTFQEEIDKFKFVGLFKNRNAMNSNLDTGGNYNEN